MKKVLKFLLLPCALVLLMGADNQEARFQNLGGKIILVKIIIGAVRLA